jgi:hypothetical protein
MALSICLGGHTNKHGTFSEGSTLRSDHPDVKSNPQMWAPEGLSTEELHAAKLAYSTATAEHIARTLAERNKELARR